MIFATVPGMVTVGCSGIRAVSRFSFPSLADLAMRGFAISFLTLANVSSLNSFLAFFFIAPPRDIETEAIQFNLGVSPIRDNAVPGSSPRVPAKVKLVLRPERSDWKSHRLRSCSTMEVGGKGSFQAAKLQRFARATVCSHSARTLPPRDPSNPTAIITIHRTVVCPVVDIL